MGLVHGIRPEKIMIPVPSFYGYEYAAKAAEADIVYFPLKEEDGFLPKEDFLERLTEDIDLLFLANPNNPTGKPVSGEYLEKLLKKCREKNIYVALDECFIEFCAGIPSMLSKVREYDNLLLIRAFTKVFAIPGVRLGYLICSNRKLLEKIREQLSEWNLSVFAQEAGIACADSLSFVKESAEYVKTERQVLTERLRKLGLRVYPGEANFILFYSEKPLYERLLQRGILIRDCGNFRGLSKGYYRIAVKSREDNEKLWKAIGECIGFE